jgi:hypothetical protein
MLNHASMKGCDRADAFSSQKKKRALGSKLAGSPHAFLCTRRSQLTMSW